MANKNIEYTKNFSFSFFIFLIFLVLKLTGNIDWSWIWVTCPLWIIPALFVGIIVLFFVCFLLIFPFALIVKILS